MVKYFSLLVIATVFAGLTGCAGRAEIWPNSNAALHKTSAEFAADSAKRFPYKASAERAGQATARAEIEYVWDRLRIVNLSDTPMTNVEIWVNQSYVVFLPTLEPKKLESIPFQAIFNDSGQSFPIGNSRIMAREPVYINSVEIYHDGKLYEVPKSLPE